MEPLSINVKTEILNPATLSLNVMMRHLGMELSASLLLPETEITWTGVISEGYMISDQPAKYYPTNF